MTTQQTTIQQQLDRLITSLQAVFHERLISVLLYGSNVRQITAIDNCDTIIVIKDLTALDLKHCQMMMQRFIIQYKWKLFPIPRYSLPLILDLTEWQNSADVYPIEYLDIRSDYHIYYGEDCVANLKITQQNLRHQCEYEIKSLLINLRQQYLLLKTQDELLRLLKETEKKLLVVFRGILRLTETELPFAYPAIIALLATKLSIDPGFFLSLLESTANQPLLKKQHIELLMQQMIDALNAVLQYVDQLTVQEQHP